MQVEFEYDVDELKKLQAKAEKLASGAVFEKTIKDVTLMLDSEVKIATPVDTGRLRASITPELGVTGFSIFGKVGTNVFYAPFIEYGTERMFPRHVIKGSSVRILGEGPYAYALKQVEAKMPDEMARLSATIEKDWSE